MPEYHYREKLLNAIIYFAKNTKYCGKTKLYKLLYYLDFRHFRETGRSVTDLTYFAWDFGPAPKKLHEDINNSAPDIQAYISLIGQPSAFTSIKPKKSFDLKHFTKRELRILHELCEIFRDAKAEDIKEASHMIDEPWDITKRTKGMYKEIDYFLSLNNSPESVSHEEAKELKRDKEQLESAFK